jgi:hypothetical protein
VSKKKALGKGLGALIGESREAPTRTSGAEPRLRELALAEIAVNRRQPRRTFSDEELGELASSIKALGVVQPVVVRPLSSASSATVGQAVSPDVGCGRVAGAPRYELIAGERRLRPVDRSACRHRDRGLEGPPRAVWAVGWGIEIGNGRSGVVDSRGIRCGQAGGVCLKYLSAGTMKDRRLGRGVR